MCMFEHQQKNHLQGYKVLQFEDELSDPAQGGGHGLR